MSKVLVSLSGGMDSTTLLGLLLEDPTYEEVAAVHFQYGSTQNRYEREAIERIAKYYKVKLYHIDLTKVMEGFKSALLGKTDIPEGAYNASGMSLTVVPSRNIIFASVMSGLAWSIGFDTIALAVHSGDHYIYPDCRPDFIDSMTRAILHGTDGRVRLIAPFLYMDKAGILTTGKMLQRRVPYELTRTCYKDQPIACGRCGACVERLEAFWKADMKDPIEYEDEEYWKTVSSAYEIDQVS